MIKTDQFAISANGKQLMRVNDNIAVDIITPAIKVFLTA